MTTTMLALALLAVGLLILVLGRATSVALAGVRAGRRAAWELDRAAWRRWMSRP